jgi:hypothetical protein
MPVVIRYDSDLLEVGGMACIRLSDHAIAIPSSLRPVSDDEATVALCSRTREAEAAVG